MQKWRRLFKLTIASKRRKYLETILKSASPADWKPQKRWVKLRAQQTSHPGRPSSSLLARWQLSSHSSADSTQSPSQLLQAVLQTLQADPQSYMGRKRIQKSKSNIEKKQNTRTNTIQFQELLLKTDISQQNRKFINKPNMANLFLTKVKNNLIEKAVISTNWATEHSQAKKKKWISNLTHYTKINLKM